MENSSTSINEDNKLILNKNENEFSHNISHIDYNIEEEAECDKIRIELEEKVNLNEEKVNSDFEATNIDEITENITINNEEIKNDTQSKFYDNLRTVIKTQENILNMTSMASEKIKYANEISLDQLNTFQEDSIKYGKYLKLIHEELHIIGDLMKKIKKDVKNN